MLPKDLIGTKKNLIDYAREHNIAIEDIDLRDIDQCANCDIWWFKKDLIQDLDGNLIDRNCETFYGL